MWCATAIALVAIAVWPWYVRSAERAAPAVALPAAAPVTKDYLDRDRLIAFWERAEREHRRGDMLSPSNLSAQYMQRYRERGDIGDVERALDQARRALRAQPWGNVPAEVGLGSALLALHRFTDALAVTRHVETLVPGDRATLVREASLDVELGRYDDARRILDRLARRGESGIDVAEETLRARFEELTGRLGAARARMRRVSAFVDAQYDGSAQGRAWFAMREGELAFEAGDDAAAIGFERDALATFPDYSEANRVLARVTCAQRDWHACLAAATASAAVVPYPEVLGAEVDAQRGLGDAAGAARTDALIRTIERIGNAEHVSDRLLAIYYDEHDERLADAYRIARRELSVRDDVFTEDTLAWAAAKRGRWAEARLRSRRAVRLGTENSLLQYHAGVIAQHEGDRGEAMRRLRLALALNAQFHAAYAPDARARLASLGAPR